MYRAEITLAVNLEEELNARTEEQALELATDYAENIAAEIEDYFGSESITVSDIVVNGPLSDDVPETIYEDEIEEV